MGLQHVVPCAPGERGAGFLRAPTARESTLPRTAAAEGAGNAQRRIAYRVAASYTLRHSTEPQQPLSRSDRLPGSDT